MALLASRDMTPEETIDELVKLRTTKQDIDDETIANLREYVNDACPMLMRSESFAKMVEADPDKRRDMKNACIVLSRLVKTNKYDRLLKERLGNIIN